MFDYWDDRTTNFYNQINGTAARNVAGDMSNRIVRASCKHIGYEVNPTTGDTGEPIGEKAFTLSAAGAGGTIDMPQEVAICASERSITDTTLPRRRRTGRQYIGPWNLRAMHQGTGNPKPDAATILAVAESSEYLASQSGAGSDWVIYSRAAGAVSVIDYGWVDDEWDTQRRREIDATARTTWTTIV